MDSKEIVLKKTFLIIQLVAAAVLMACFWLPFVYNYLSYNYLEVVFPVIIAAITFVLTVLVFLINKKVSSTNALAISAMIVAAIGMIIIFVFKEEVFHNWWWNERIIGRIMPPISLALVILPVVELKKLSMEIKQKNGANGYLAQTYSQPVNIGMIGNYIQPTQMPMNNGMYIDPTREQPINDGMPVNPAGQSYQNDDRNNNPNGIR